MIDEKHLQAAIRAADPAIRHRDMKIEAAKDDPIIQTKVFIEETAYLENAAKTRVRRVVAALNGIDIDKNAATWTDIPVIIPRATADRIKDAMLNDRVAPILDEVLGEDAASILLGDIAVL